jgi:2-C-methyl-D-erythritol 2,4-cyclodiphosphate synthase
MSQCRFGFGYDIHRFGDGRKLFLGGIEIPFDKGLLGHSDADVLLHAIADALLGACALGDIGRHFPDTDPRYKNISSLVLIENVVRLLEDHHFGIVNIDATLVLEQPRIAPFVERMRNAIAPVLRVTIEQISIKATTNEKIGSLGAGEGIAAYAVASVEEKAVPSH